MISLKKKRYISASVALLLVCFALIFFSLFQLSSISQEVEKEHFNYLKTLSDYYCGILQNNLNNFVECTLSLGKEIEPYLLQKYVEAPEKQLARTQLYKTIDNFFASTNTLKHIDITYVKPDTAQIWYLGFSSIETDKNREKKKVLMKRHLINRVKEELYLLEYLNYNRNKPLQLLPLVYDKKENKGSLHLSLPISYSLYREGNVNCNIKFFFSLEELSQDLKDFKEVSEQVIRKLFVVLNMGDILQVELLSSPSFMLVANKPKNLEWPALLSEDLKNIVKAFNVSQGNIGEKDSKLETILKIFRVKGTQDFWGAFFQMSQENFTRLNSNFFLSLSMLVLSLGFIFCAFYYTVSYFHVEATNRTLERLVLEKTLQVDSLTGAYTRAVCQKKAIKMIGNQEALALAVLDIDFFKQVNDQYGHLAGDNVLIDLCQRIKKLFATWQAEYEQQVFLLARWGGEEFVILLSILEEKQQTVKLLTKLQKTLSEPSSNTQLPLYTLSMGVSFLTNYEKGKREPSEIFKFLFKEADLALYDAKQGGRNQIIFYTNSEEGSLL